MKTVYGKEAREGLKRGIDILANAVKVTLGPKGRTVVIDDNGKPIMTKDGVTVAKAVVLDDSLENMGVEMIKDAASRQADSSGDGTTTTTVLVQAIVEQGIKSITQGVNPMTLKKGMENAIEQAVFLLKERSIEVENNEIIRQVATISANNDEVIGKLIADAILTVGENGIVKTGQSKSTSTYVDVVDGVEIDRGFISPHFITDMSTMSCDLEDALVLVYDKKITAMKQLVPVLEMVNRQGKSLLLVCEDIEGEALNNLILNVTNGIIKFAAIKAPGFNETRRVYLEDLAILVGAKLLSEREGHKLENVTLNDLGHVGKAKVTRDKTVLLKEENSLNEQDKQALDLRVSLLKERLKIETEEWDINQIKDRIAKLAGGIGIIYIGANSEIELREKTDRIDDALAATKAAIEEGVIIGGGVALYKIANRLECISMDATYLEGFDIIKQALTKPYETIMNNAGMTDLSNLEEYGFNQGYNVLTEQICDLFEEGIIDPFKVTREALENAVSVASMLLTTECVITN